MALEFAQGWAQALPEHGRVIATLLLSVRLAPLFVMTPLLQAFGVPALVRVLLVLGLAAAFVFGMPQSQVDAWHAADVSTLATAALKELALGAVLALAVLAAFAAISTAGRLIDVQAGFGMGQVFDPVTRRDVPLVTSAFEKLSVIVFFSVNGHHALLRGIAFSLDRFPLGASWPVRATYPAVAQHVAAMFGLAFSLAAPVVVCLMLVDLAMGVIARNLPQINMFVIGLPVKMIVAVAALAVWMGGMGEAMNRAYASIYRTWDSVLSVPTEGRR